MYYPIPRDEAKNIIVFSRSIRKDESTIAGEMGLPDDAYGEP